MDKLRSVYRFFIDLNYIFNVYFSFILGRKIIFYNKKHPIFTTCFEELKSEKYVYFYPVKSINLFFLNKLIEKKAILYYLDAAAFFEPKNNCPIIVECEALPLDKFIQNNRVKKVFVESLSAGRIHLNLEKVELLYPSIKPQTYKEKPEDGYVTILSVGFGSMIKGFDVLFEIYTELKKTNKIKLIIAGVFGHNFNIYPEVTEEAYNSANFGAIVEKLKSDPNVTFSAYSRKTLLTKIYPKADVYIHLCRLETFGFSILEAMSFGLPIIAPHFKAIPEMIEHEKNGFLVSSMKFDNHTNDYSVDINSSEWKDLCKKEAEVYLKKLLDSKELRLKMGQESLKKVVQKFNVEDKKSKLEKVYLEIESDILN